MKHGTIRLVMAATIATTVVVSAPTIAAARVAAAPVATQVVAATVATPIDLPDTGSADAVRGAFASVVFFGVVGLCLLRLLPADQCHFF